MPNPNGRFGHRLTQCAIAGKELVWNYYAHAYIERIKIVRNGDNIRRGSREIDSSYYNTRPAD